MTPARPRRPLRLFPISDLHLERRRPAAIPAPVAPFDVLVCAGDVWEGEPARGLAVLLGLAGERPLVLVPGNHEHYAPGGDPRTAPELLGALDAAVRETNAAAGRTRVALLRAGAATVIGGVRFVGATLWSDWSLAGRWLAPDAPDRPADPVAFAAARMTDPVTGSREYRAIRQGDGTAWTPQAAMAAHAEDRARLAAALARPHAGPTVAVTHHPPIAEAADRYRDAPGVPWWVPAFYATTLLADLPAADRPAAWISGHFHAGHDMRLHGTRCVANPVEGAGCDPALIVAV
ncbi:metallophosphoesterase [Methylobacterium isbiliense]|jgi:3',5'-cyclic AMP phosphodiesterase CpdA|uniref:3',5'-cyclic adenosine monophosphate phosphodiesterase CpdA n=1 Tax=Methylobacterium isbiliense TaxID=315478 RepID=A0ABQ4S8Y4_9HYPH|nr:metallophosphoesterase [Methylobacterium isbiliense]MDN3622870.1 metallophosphoesterase [Methylobacterium isbiliense]GJD98324.1 3',5'-cyclic adenosine monophosphate phosphodiesterase CpdA [Methylobacterium isbiliense]